MKMKDMSAVILAGIMTLTMTACGSRGSSSGADSQNNSAAAETEAASMTEEPESTSKDGGYKILLASYDQSIYPGLEQKGVEAACAELGMEVTVQSPATYPDLASQVQIIETAAADGVDAIIVHPVDSEGICDTLQKAADQGIAVFVIDTQTADKTGTLGFYCSNNYNLGVEAAQQMAEALNGKGEVAILAGNEAALAHYTRRDGMLDTFKEKYPDISVVDVQYDNVDALKANQMASAFILTYPNLNGMMCTGEVGLSGILSAVDEADKAGAYTIVGFDSGAATNQAIKDGSIIGSVMQSPYQMGYLSAKAAYDYLHDGREPEEYVNDTGLLFVTKDNIDTEEAQNVMYE